MTVALFKKNEMLSQLDHAHALLQYSIWSVEVTLYPTGVGI
jgi:hypothetical protein